MARNLKNDLLSIPEELLIYAQDKDRFLVVLIASYGEESDIDTAKKACWAALQLTRDEGSSGTQWVVLDRKTGEAVCLEQDEFEEGGDFNEEE